VFIKKGIVYPEPDKLRGMIVWKPTKSFMLHDFVFMNPQYNTEENKDLWDLLDKYYETVMGPVIASTGKTLFRVLPVNKTIEMRSAILPHEDAAAIVEKSRKIALAECVCRKRARSCDHPLEVCLSFDIAADIMLQREISREITKKEALEVLRISEEAGLLHCVDNRQSGLFFICNCCSCGCGAVRAATVHGSRNAIVPSRYKAVIDADNCSQCGVCVDKCQFSAITLDADGIHLDESLCYGCGNCATNCPQSVIVMQEVRAPSHIPEKGDSFMGF
jgi:ferredoxin